MTVKSTLDIQGKLDVCRLAEVIAEISSAHLSGSLRAGNGDKKTVIYFEFGKTVFVASNERAFRLSEILLAENRIDRQFLRENSDIVNDIQLSERVVATGNLKAGEIREIVGKQCASIVTSTLAWADGDWIFSPHSRVKQGVSFDIGVRPSLLAYSRSLSSTTVTERFRSVNEWFVLNADVNGLDLQPHEAFVLSRFDSGQLTVAQLIALSGLPQDTAVHIVYSLWLSGLLTRYGWNAIFSEKLLSQIRSANLELITPAAAVPKPVSKPVVHKPVIQKPIVQEPVEEQIEEVPELTSNINLEEVLTRIETAENYYEVLGLETSAKLHTIRKAYFQLAKLLHPDRYHSESAETLRRVENAFTELAQAHETLRNSDSRQGYDIRIRQAQRDKEQGRSDGADSTRQEEQAAKDFDRGFDLQLNGDFEVALPYLARAVYYAPKNARYHAFYGKALAADESQRHKAENEFAAAIKLEPQNDSFRIMLAEFFMRYKLFKRAEGELKRLLSESPNNAQAQTLLDSLQNK